MSGDQPQRRGHGATATVITEQNPDKRDSLNLKDEASDKSTYETGIFQLPGRSSGKGMMFRAGWHRRVTFILVLVIGIWVVPRLKETFRWFNFVRKRVPPLPAGSFIAGLERAPVPELQYFTGSEPEDFFNITAALWDSPQPEPFVFKAHTFAAANPIKQGHLVKWTPKALSEMFGPYQWGGIFRSPSKEFRTYNVQHPLTNHLVEKKQWSPPLDMMQMSGYQLLHALQNSTRGGYYYQMNQPGGDLYKWLPNVTDIIPLDSPMIQAHLMLFMSSPGVTNPLHYEVSDSIHMQMYGRTRIVLLPTSHLEDVYLYPNTHPHARQSKINFLEDRAKILKHFPRASAIKKSWEVVLVPGDLLVIPANMLYWKQSLPGWPSFEANWWTLGKDMRSVMEIFEEPISWFSNDNDIFDQNKTVPYVTKYTQMLIERTFELSEPETCGKDRDATVACRDQFLMDMIEQENHLLHMDMDYEGCDRHKFEEEEMLATFKDHVERAAGIVAKVTDKYKRNLYLRIILDAFIELAVKEERDKTLSFLQSCVCTSCQSQHADLIDLHESPYELV